MTEVLTYICRHSSLYSSVMRIWSLHPRYLDTKGLVAVWREALLARHVLEGKTKGYKYHPQLKRFRNSKDPLACINMYLSIIYEEALARGYNFDRSKIGSFSGTENIPVTKGQVDYEIKHLLNKLKIRDRAKYSEISELAIFEANPLFSIVQGGVEDWEITI